MTLLLLMKFISNLSHEKRKEKFSLSTLAGLKNIIGEVQRLILYLPQFVAKCKSGRLKSAYVELLIMLCS